MLKQFGSNAPGSIVDSSVIGEGVSDVLIRSGQAERIPEPNDDPPSVKSVTATARRKTTA